MEKGLMRIDRDSRLMPVMKALKDEWVKTKPLDGVRVAACLHITTETAVLARLLMAGGAEVCVCASNPLSTQDDVVEAMRSEGVVVMAKRGDGTNQYYKAIDDCLELRPDVLIDDGCDMIARAHRREDLWKLLIGATEETTTGVNRLVQMEKAGVLKFPVVAVNDSRTKHLFDNRYGTGQSTVDALMRATNRMIAGATFLVCGYGMCGKGVAARASGLGANVIVAEVDPVRALEARMDGFIVERVKDAVKKADFVVTVTGNTAVIDEECFRLMKDGAVLANSGHFDVEIDVDALKRMSKDVVEVTPVVHDYVLSDGRVVTLLGHGRLANLVVAEGHPAQVMDLSFANQALAVKWLVDKQGDYENPLQNCVYVLPDEFDRRVASLKLEAMGVKHDVMTEKQVGYMSDWKQGT